MNKFLNIFSAIMLLGAGLLYGQKPPQGALRLKGKVNAHSIQLRWAPTDPVSWQLLNQYGYRLERSTTFRNGQLLGIPERKVVLEQQKPAPLAAWEAAWLQDSTDQNLPVAVQALYGESFYLEAGNGNQLAHFVNQQREQENRYAFALLAADQSIRVAELMGLYYEDQQIQQGERYLYSLIPLLPDSLEPVKAAYQLLFTEEVVELPQPFEARAAYLEGKVQVSWDWKSLEDFYTAYEVQRSDDGGKAYFDLTDTPFIQPAENHHSRIMLFPDTLGTDEGTFYYRVRGRDAFGAAGPYSDPLKVEAYPVMSFTPEIAVWENEDNGSVEIAWKINPDEAYAVESLRLARAETDQGPFKILRGDLPVHDGSFRDIAPESSNYYKLAAVDKAGRENWSYTQFIQPMDSIPPLPPVALTGKMDTTGLVQVQWAPNKEKDLFGYRVYRANEPNGTWVQATKREIFTTHFTDSLPVKVLNKKVYYKLLAVDKRGNPSDYSELLEINRPDVIPPSPPVMVKGASHTRGPAFYWQPSGSEDVATYQVYRKAASETERWEWIASLEPVEDEQFFLDSTIYDFEPYYYLMIAIDDSGLESVPSRPVGVSRFEEKIKKGVHDFKGKRNNEGALLEWKSPLGSDFKVDVYRGQGDEPIRFYKRISGKEFLDAEVLDNKKYRYRVRLAYEDGQVSKFSQEVRL
ncbi:hypothetical protein [Persicobacter diffluens]|uniref:Fibronectin type-III domain-containing protein n=1 Tax=Persicobacter diffluens TaxID=981 RepID=A0AAN4W1V8_9BACT|nr:hypothetical protein PEDI_36300 [Persicobacter diffluens]